MSENCNSAVMPIVVFVLLCLRVRYDENHKSWAFPIKMVTVTPERRAPT